jgi:DNA-binding transcriptional LysR family regulator
MDNLAAMAIFVRVVEDKGFSSAAQALGLSKSAVSKHVAALENRLGVRLLNRTTRRLSLTDAGTAYFERAQKIVAEAEEADREVAMHQTTPRGQLRVNAPMSFGVRHIAPAIPEFQAKHPEVLIDLTLNDRMVDLVDEGYDLAVRITRLADSSLVARKLAPFRRVICASPGYFRQHARPVRPQDLKNHNCLIYTLTASPEEWRLQGAQGVETVRVTGNLRCNNGDVLREALLAGVGIAPMPTFLVGDDLRSGKLEAVLMEWSDSQASINAVYPHGRLLQPKVRAFIDFLAARFGPNPYWEDKLSIANL